MRRHDKPLKGSIQQWIYAPETGRIYGMREGKDIRTSKIVGMQVRNGVIEAETQNSIYHLGNCL